MSVSGNARTVTAGNPELDPFRADAYDLAFEWYFANESLVSVALFYKDIKTFVQTIRETRPFTDNPLGLPDSVAIAACGATPGCSPSASWDFTLPANTPGGDLKGFEIAYQQPFSFLPGVWSNFGAILNYTGVESEIDYLNAAGAIAATASLTGLSEDAYNATLYFDNQTFSARVSAAYRSEYLTTIPGRDGNDVEGTLETLNIDFSTSYNINDHFSISLEALNLTDEVQDQRVDSLGRPPVVLSPPGTPVLPGCTLQVLTSRSADTPVAVAWPPRRARPRLEGQVAWPVPFFMAPRHTRLHEPAPVALQDAAGGRHVRVDCRFPRGRCHHRAQR